MANPINMKKTLFVILLIVLNILVIGAFIIWYCNRTYPMIGHDYRLFMPYMIDSYLHQKINGLTVQWYTPSFAGGRPVYSSPEDFQFSLPQFLLWVVNPWIAILASLLIFSTIGFNWDPWQASWEPFFSLRMVSISSMLLLAI